MEPLSVSRADPGAFITCREISGVAVRKITSLAARNLTRAVFSIAFGLALSSVGHAQTVASNPPAAPEYESQDQMSVDLFSGQTKFKVNTLSIGGLSHILMSTNDGFRATGNSDSFCGSFNSGTDYPNFTFTFGTFSTRFLYSGSTYSSLGGDGSTLIINADGSYTLTARDGTTYHWVANATGCTNDGNNAGVAVDKVTYPNGRMLSLYYKTGAGSRLQSVVSNDGWQIKYNYDTTSGNLVSVVGINNAVEYCDPTADTCSLSNAWPTATFNWAATGQGPPGTFTVTDAAGRVTRFTEDQYGEVIGVKPPSSPSADVYTYTYCAQSQPWDCLYASQPVGKWMTERASANGAVWNYNWTLGIGCCFGGDESYSQYQSTDPVGGQRTSFILNASDRKPYLQWLRTETATVNFSGLLAVPLVGSVVGPDGVTTSYTYDSRRNVTQTTRGSGSTTAVISAGYDSTCTNPVTCNKPNWVKDANGNQTDFTYDPTHGGVLTVTAPADMHGVRPQTRYHYIQRYAWVKSSSGSYVHASSPVWLLDHESFCRTGAASGDGCAITGDEVVTSYDYGPDSGPNNLLLHGKVVTGDGQSLRACYSYDRFGHKISETKPRAGLSSCP